MSVGTFVQPAYSTQGDPDYLINIDNCIAVVGGVGAAFAAHEQTPADMTVRVDAGRIFNLNTATLTEVAAQDTGTITAPSTNPRYDIVYIDRKTGAVGVATGAEAGSPSDPAIPAGKKPITRIRLTTSTTAISNTLLDDLRGMVTVAHEDSHLDVFAGYDNDWTAEDIEVKTYAQGTIGEASEFLGFSSKDLDTAATDTGSPVTTALILDVTKNGTSVYATKPQYDAGSTTFSPGTLKTDGTEDFDVDDVWAFKVTEVGATTPGKGFMGSLHFRKI